MLLRAWLHSLHEFVLAIAAPIVCENDLLDLTAGSAKDVLIGLMGFRYSKAARTERQPE